MPLVKLEHLELNMEDDMQKQLPPPTVKMEPIEIKEELNVTFLDEHDIWDGSEVKLDPKVEMTIEEHPLVLPKEVADCTLTDMLNSPVEVIQPEAGGGTSAVLVNTTLPESGMHLLLNEIPSSLPDFEIPSVHHYSRDIVQKRLCEKRKTTTAESTGIQMCLHKTDNSNESLSENEISNSTEKTVRCDIQLYTCDTCQKSFSRLADLNTHKIIHTASKLFTCDTCHKSFSHKLNLKKHEKTHTGSKPYMCDYCSKCFNAHSNLKKHIITHTGLKPYTCDTCHKCFSALANLKKHIRIHTGSKPYTCETCLKCFTTQFGLKSHSRLHTGSKPYTCETCHINFRQLSHLKSHKIIHTGRKPYTCNTCHKCFGDLSNFKAHKRIHTGSKPYSCDICHNCFSHPSTLQKHKNTHSKHTLDQGFPTFLHLRTT